MKGKAVQRRSGFALDNRKAVSSGVSLVSNNIHQLFQERPVWHAGQRLQQRELDADKGELNRVNTTGIMNLT